MGKLQPGEDQRLRIAQAGVYGAGLDAPRTGRSWRRQRWGAGREGRNAEREALWRVQRAAPTQLLKWLLWGHVGSVLPGIFSKEAEN